MNFKEVIKEKGLKQSWIAERIGLSNALLSYYLSGSRHMPQEVRNKLKEILA